MIFQTNYFFSDPCKICKSNNIRKFLPLFVQKQLQKESNYVHCCQHFKTDIPIHGKHPLPFYKLRKPMFL